MTSFYIFSSGGHYQLFKSHNFHVKEADKLFSFYSPNLIDSNIIFLKDASKGISFFLLNFIRSAYFFFKYKPEKIISFGAGVSVPMMILGKIFNKKVLHHELICQINELSKTGKFAKYFKVKILFYNKSLFDRTASKKSKFIDYFSCINFYEKNKKLNLIKIFIVFGTAPEQFNSLKNLIELLFLKKPSNYKIFIQSGYTSLNIDDSLYSRFLKYNEFDKHIKNSDLIISHAGSGILQSSLENGKVPILIPRLVSLGEHTDPSQEIFAKFCHEEGYAYHLKSFENNEIDKAIDFCIQKRTSFNKKLFSELSKKIHD